MNWSVPILGLQVQVYLQYICNTPCVRITLAECQWVYTYTQCKGKHAVFLPASLLHKRSELERLYTTKSGIFILQMAYSTHPGNDMQKCQCIQTQSRGRAPRKHASQWHTHTEHYEPKLGNFKLINDKNHYTRIFHSTHILCNVH